MEEDWNDEMEYDSSATLRRLHNPLVTKEKVLVVEDDSSLRTALSEHLEARGFEVTAVSDGISAIEILRMMDHDAVLLDLGIPRMSGTKFLHELRREPEISDIPIVLLTGSDEQDIDRAARHGVFAVHRKPTKAKHIARSLRSAVYYA